GSRPRGAGHPGARAVGRVAASGAGDLAAPRLGGSPLAAARGPAVCSAGRRGAGARIPPPGLPPGAARRPIGSFRGRGTSCNRDKVAQAGKPRYTGPIARSVYGRPLTRCSAKRQLFTVKRGG